MPPAVQTRNKYLQEAARLFAQCGFRGTTISDLGDACELTGPALYRHFSSKREILAHLLIDVSEQLLYGGIEVASAAGECPQQVLRQLVDFHAAFAIENPELIRIQSRDLDCLAQDEIHNVRRLQREYADIWIQGVIGADLQRARPQAHAMVHAVFGLLNSTPHSGSSNDTRDVLVKTAIAALGLKTP